MMKYLSIILRYLLAIPLFGILILFYFGLAIAVQFEEKEEFDYFMDLY